MGWGWGAAHSIRLGWASRQRGPQGGHRHQQQAEQRMFDASPALPKQARSCLTCSADASRRSDSDSRPHRRPAVWRPLLPLLPSASHCCNSVPACLAGGAPEAAAAAGPPGASWCTSACISCPGGSTSVPCGLLATCCCTIALSRARPGASSAAGAGRRRWRTSCRLAPPLPGPSSMVASPSPGSWSVPPCCCCRCCSCACACTRRSRPCRPPEVTASPCRCRGLAPCPCSRCCGCCGSSSCR